MNAGSTVAPLAAALLTGLAAFVWQHPRRLRRLASRWAARDPSGDETVDAGPRGRRSRWWAGLAGVAVALAIGGVAGVVVGAVAAFLAGRVVARFEPEPVRRRRRALRDDLPLAGELVASCLRAGLPLEGALEAVGRAMDGPLGRELRTVAAYLRLGTDPHTTWAGFTADPVLAGFGRAMARSADSGAPLADLLDRLAQDARRAVRSEADTRARAVGVKAAAPLGLCFLPAFVLVGIVPIVAGTVQPMLGR